MYAGTKEILPVRIHVNNVYDMEDRETEKQVEDHEDHQL